MFKSGKVGFLYVGIHVLLFRANSLILLVELGPQPHAEEHDIPFLCDAMERGGDLNA
jgi:hypothetical protein